MEVKNFKGFPRKPPIKEIHNELEYARLLCFESYEHCGGTEWLTGSLTHWLDFANAFGSVHHYLIWYTLEYNMLLSVCFQQCQTHTKI